MNSISTDSIAFYSKLISDYQNGRLKELNWVDFKYELPSIVEKAKKRTFSHRTALTKALSEQYQDLGLLAEVEKRIDQLSLANTFTVCTGHQLSLFGGPAFFFSKILECIKLADTLSIFDPDRNYVPVFWLASEDHDFAEIATVQLFNNTLTWEQESAGPVGRLKTENLTPLVEQFCEILGTGEKAKEIAAVIKKAYQSNYNLAQATRILVHQLLGKKGLLIIDGDDPTLKKLFTPVAKQELTLQVVEKSLSSRIADFESEGYKIQASPRPINLFYLTEQYRGRIIRTEGEYSTADGTMVWSSEEILRLIEEEPEMISPNVFLRPVYQELILPNVAYIGGAGEIAYWLELPPLFETLNLSYPIPVVRNSFVYWDKKSIEKLNKLGLSITQLFEELPLLEAQFVEDNAKNVIELKEQKKQIKQVFDEIKAIGSKIDPNIHKSVAGELSKTNSSIENLEKRFRNAEKRNLEQQIKQISALKSKVFPNGIFQERHASFFEFYLKSDKDLFQILLERINSFESHLKVVL